MNINLADSYLYLHIMYLHIIKNINNIYINININNLININNKYKLNINNFILIYFVTIFHR